MEEETNNSELLINQPTEPTQPTPAPDTEVKQEQSITSKQEESKMSEVDLSKYSLDELQAAIEKKKAEMAKTNLIENASMEEVYNWIMANGGRPGMTTAELETIIVCDKCPYKLTQFCSKDEDGVNFAIAHNGHAFSNNDGEYGGYHEEFINTYCL